MFNSRRLVSVLSGNMLLAAFVINSHAAVDRRVCHIIVKVLTQKKHPTCTDDQRD